MITNVERIFRKVKREAKKEGKEVIYTDFVNEVLQILDDAYQGCIEDKAKWYILGQIGFANKLIQEGFNEEKVIKIV